MMRRSLLPTTVTALAVAAALAPAAGARPAGPDAAVPPSSAPLRVAAPATDSGLDAGWAVLLCGGAVLAGGAAGFAGGRIRRPSTVSPS